MLPFKFKNQVCKEILLRNVHHRSMNYYLRIHSDPQAYRTGILDESKESMIESLPTEDKSINPSFVIKDTRDSEFGKQFEKLTTPCLVVEIRSLQDPKFSLPIMVNLSSLEYIGESLSDIKSFDFHLIVFRMQPPTDLFESMGSQTCTEFWTTKDIHQVLMSRNLMTIPATVANKRKSVA